MVTKEYNPFNFSYKMTNDFGDTLYSDVGDEDMREVENELLELEVQKRTALEKSLKEREES